MNWKILHGKVIVAFYSKHDNHREDRIWKVGTCEGNCATHEYPCSGIVGGFYADFEHFYGKSQKECQRKCCGLTRCKSFDHLTSSKYGHRSTICRLFYKSKNDPGIRYADGTHCGGTYNYNHYEIASR